MKIIPALTKYKKPHTPRLNKLKGKKGNKLACYPVGLRHLSNKYFTYKQLESSRRAITRLIKPKDKINKKNQKIAISSRKSSHGRRKRKKVAKRILLIRSTLIDPITKKPLQVRMGKGKGNVDSYVYTSKGNRLLLELSKVRFKLTKIHHLFKKASIKLPGQMKFVYNRGRKEKYFFYTT
jgi:large subunit ribosomal protein L16